MVMGFRQSHSNRNSIGLGAWVADDVTLGKGSIDGRGPGEKGSLWIRAKERVAHPTP